MCEASGPLLVSQARFHVGIPLPGLLLPFTPFTGPLSPRDLGIYLTLSYLV
jgi:hypothetical protein